MPSLYSNRRIDSSERVACIRSTSEMVHSTTITYPKPVLTLLTLTLNMDSNSNSSENRIKIAVLNAVKGLMENEAAYSTDTRKQKLEDALVIIDAIIYDYSKV